MAIDLYESQARAPQAPAIELGVMPQVVTADGSVVGGALAKVGEALTHVAAKMKVARDQTETATATTEYLVKLNEAQREGTQSRDFRGAPQTFKDYEEQIRQEAIGKISDPVRREQLNARLVGHGLSALNRVQSHARGVEADTNIAAVDQHEITAQQEIAAATTPREREAAIARYRNSVSGAVAAGWITPPNAVVRMNRLMVAGDRTELAQDSRNDPAGTWEKLKDPKNYANIPPVMRETYKDHVANLQDQNVIDQIAIDARNDPDTAKEKIDKIILPHNRYRAQHTIDQVQQQQTAEEDRRIKAAASYNRSSDPVTKLMQDGRDVGDDRIEAARAINVQAAMRGDLEAAKTVEEIDFQMAIRPHILRAKQTPLPELDNQIKQMDAHLSSAGGNATARDVALLKSYKAVADNIRSKRNTEPIVLGGPDGSRDYAIGPLNPKAAPDDPNFASEILRRGVITNRTQPQHGGAAHVFTELEADALKKRWGEAGPEERTALLNTFATTLSGNAYRDTIKAVAGDSPALGLVARMTVSNPKVAKEIMYGQALEAAEAVPEKKSTLGDVINSKMGGTMYFDIGEHNAALDATKWLYLARRNKKGSLYDAQPDDNLLSSAMEDVTGKITSQGGVRAPLPPGITPAQFSRMWRQLDDKAIDVFGGARDASGQPVSPYTMKNYAVLKPFNVGGTRFAVGVKDDSAPGGFAPFTTKDLTGDQLVIDLPLLARHQAEREAERLRTRGARRALSREDLIRGLPGLDNPPPAPPAAAAPPAVPAAPPDNSEE